jgi:Putative zinc-finger
MSIEDRDPSCHEIAQALPELALGVLTGRDRAASLAHVESCPRCADELEQLARAADAVVWMAGEVEPPVGFEMRLFSRMGLNDDLAEPRRRRVRPPVWVIATAAAVVALVVGLAIGWSTDARSPSRTSAAGGPPPSGAIVTAATLRADGHTVGRVSISGGSKPWMYMSLDGSAARGTVTCQVVTDDGVIHTVGTFTAKNGYGTWGAALPVPPRDVRKAQVVSPQGTVLATATLG